MKHKNMILALSLGLILAGANQAHAAETTEEYLEESAELIAENHQAPADPRTLYTTNSLNYQDYLIRDEAYRVFVNPYGQEVNYLGYNTYTGYYTYYNPYTGQYSYTYTPYSTTYIPPVVINTPDTTWTLKPSYALDEVEVGRGHKYLIPGTYKRDDLLLQRADLQKAYDKSKLTVDGARQLMRTMPNFATRNQGKLLKLITEAETLQNEARSAIVELDTVLAR